HGCCGIVDGEMMREGEAGADLRRELCAVVARSEKPDRRQRDVGWHCVDFVKWMAGWKLARLQKHQLLKALEEVVVLADPLPPPQRVRCDRIGAGRAAEPKIDAAGIKRFQHL